MKIRSYSAALALVAIAGCADGPSASAARATPVEPVRRVAAVEVESRAFEGKVTLDGELLPFESVDIHARVDGLVNAVAVDRGSVVRRGQVLARLAAPELGAERAAATADLLASRQSLDHLRAASRTTGAVAGHDVEIAEAAVAANTARVDALRALERYLVITAPFDGVVTERNVHRGALVSSSSAGAPPLFRVVDARRLRLVVAVPEAQVGGLVDGTRTAFTVRAWPERPFEGTLRRVSHVVDARTRTMAVELDVDNADSALAPGMYAAVEWPITRDGPSLFVPRTAIVQTPTETFVARVRAGIVERVPVTRGANLEDAVEVRGALTARDLIARRGSVELRTGDRVELTR